MQRKSESENQIVRRGQSFMTGSRGAQCRDHWQGGGIGPGNEPDSARITWKQDELQRQLRPRFVRL